MARVCAVSGKKTGWGKRITRRGLAKAKGGVGLKTTGITRRSFRANLQPVRCLLPNGKLLRLRLATSVIKKGEITIRYEGTMRTLPLVKATRGRQAEYVRNQAHAPKS
jgi:large subunit ribosomal protein L28